MSHHVVCAVMAPPIHPDAHRRIRLRRLGLRDATARLVAELAFGEARDAVMVLAAAPTFGEVR